MKRIIVTTVVILMLSVLFAACGRGGSNSGAYPAKRDGTVKVVGGSDQNP